MKSTWGLGIPLTIGVLLLTDVILSAAPIPGNTHGGDYLVPAADLSRVSAGVYLQARDRMVNVYGVRVPLETRRTAGYLGLDVLSWLTVYGTIADAKHRLAYRTNEGNNEYGGGVMLSLLDHEILDPTLMEDVIRINATLQQTKGELFSFGKVTSFTEVYGALTVHIINEIEGSKLFWPDAIGFYVGPTYSIVRAEKLHEEQATGFGFGLELYLSEKVTLNLGGEQFDNDYKYLYGLHIRF